jgi:hypothetical protein
MQRVSNPTPNSVDLDLVTISTSKSTFHPTLDSFQAALYLPDAGPDKAFGHITIPQIISKKSTLIATNQTMQIADMEQFIEYNKRTLEAATYQVSFTGRTGLHEGSFPVTHVNFTKTVDINGRDPIWNS